MTAMGALKIGDVLVVAKDSAPNGDTLRSIIFRPRRNAIALRRLAPQLLRVVPLGDDSVEFGPVDLGHDPRIHLLLAEVGRRHHAERREQAALDGSVVLEQRLIGNGSLIALDFRRLRWGLGSDSARTHAHETRRSRD